MGIVFYTDTYTANPIYIPQMGITQQINSRNN